MPKEQLDGMASSADRPLALLAEQQNLQSQLEPLQTELLDLTSKLNSTILECVHQDIALCIELAQKGREEVLNEENKVRKHRKAIDLKVLGTDNRSEDEPQSSWEDIVRAKEEEKCASKLFARIEKLSAAKFLAFCNEQRTAVTSIWGCSVKIRNILDDIIRDLTSDTASSASHSTEFFDAPESVEDTSSETNVLRQELRQANAEIEKLKVKVLELESENTTLQHSQFSRRHADLLDSLIGEVEQQLKTAIERLESDLEAMTERLQLEENDHADTLRRAMEAENKLRIQLPCVNNAIANRKRAIALSKSVFQNGRRQYPSGVRPDWDSIQEGNSAVHRGDFDTDQSIFLLGKMSSEEQSQCEKMYDLSLSARIKSRRVKSMVNYRASMFLCGSFTCGTLNADLDATFLRLRQRAEAISASVKNRCPNDEIAQAQELDTNHDMHDILDKARMITNTIVDRFCALKNNTTRRSGN